MAQRLLGLGLGQLNILAATLLYVIDSRKLWAVSFLCHFTRLTIAGHVHLPQSRNLVGRHQSRLQREVISNDSSSSGTSYIHYDRVYSNVTSQRAKQLYVGLFSVWSCCKICVRGQSHVGLHLSTVIVAQSFRQIKLNSVRILKQDY